MNKHHSQIPILNVTPAQARAKVEEAIRHEARISPKERNGAKQKSSAS